MTKQEALKWFQFRKKICSLPDRTREAEDIAIECIDSVIAQEPVKPVGGNNMNDNVLHPNHYADKQIEVIDYIRDTLTPDGFVDYCLGNVIKYVSRWRKKGGIEDLEKAAVYLNWAMEQAVKNKQLL